MSDLVKVLASYLSFISEKPTRNPRFCPPNQNHLAVIDELWTGAVAISQPCNDVFSWCNMDTLFVKGRCWCWGKGQSVVEKYNTNVNLVFMANKDQLLRPRLCLGLCWSLFTIKSQSWFSEERNTTQHTCPYYWSFAGRVAQRAHHEEQALTTIWKWYPARFAARHDHDPFLWTEQTCYGGHPCMFESLKSVKENSKQQQQQRLKQQEQLFAPISILK